MDVDFDCGCEHYNVWVDTALGYLPDEVVSGYEGKLTFLSTGTRDATRVARKYREQGEIILLSDRILPNQRAQENDPDIRYFIFAVLHEVVHATKDHKSPKFDELSPDEAEVQEDEADALALCWFNQQIAERKNPYLPPLTMEEVNFEREKNQMRMEKLYSGDLYASR